MNKPGARSPVPNDVKRRLRQEAGFGCCVCGHPIFEYHHIIPYSKEQHFRAEDMMILCPNHHEEATNGALDENEQRLHKAQPSNLLNYLAYGELISRQNDLEVGIGSNVFRGPGDLLLVGEEALLNMTLSSEGTLLLNLKLYDEQDNLLAEVGENEWQSHVQLVWDLEFSHKRLKIRQAHRKVNLEIDFSKKPIKLSGKLWYKGNKIDIGESSLVLGKESTITFCTFENTALRVLPNGEGMEIIARMPPGPVPAPGVAKLKLGRNTFCTCGSGKKRKWCGDRANPTH